MGTWSNLEIGELEHKVTSVVGRVVPESVQNAYSSTRDALKGLTSRGETEEGDDFGVKQAQEANKNSASMSPTLDPGKGLALC